MQFINEVILDDFEKEVKALKSKENFILKISHIDHLIHFISLVDDDIDVTTDKLKDIKYQLKTNELFNNEKDYTECKIKFNFNEELNIYDIDFMFDKNKDTFLQSENEWTSLDKHTYCLAC